MIVHATWCTEFSLLRMPTPCICMGEKVCEFKRGLVRRWNSRRYPACVVWRRWSVRTYRSGVATHGPFPGSGWLRGGGGGAGPRGAATRQIINRRLRKGRRKRPRRPPWTGPSAIHPKNSARIKVFERKIRTLRVVHQRLLNKFRICRLFAVKSAANLKCTSNFTRQN